jgi:hypothetical protein
MILRRSLTALVFTALLAPTVALADTSDADRATARTLAGEGQEALEKKDFTTAADRFARADSIIHAPTLELGLARAQVGLGKLVAAQETYNRIGREGVAAGSPPTWAVAVETARKEGEALAPRVPQVVITVKGSSSVKVTIDDAPIPSAALGVKRPADPGKHLIRAVAEGFAPAEASVVLREGAKETVTLELKAPTAAKPPVPTVVTPPGPTPPPKPTGAAVVPPPPPPVVPAGPEAPRGSTQKTLGFVALGVGGAGLVLGAVTGGLAIGKHGDLATSCKNGCPTDKLDELSSYHTLGTLSTVGFIVGGAGAVAGTILLLTLPAKKPAEEPRVTPVLGLGYLGAKGTF